METSLDAIRPGKQAVVIQVNTEEALRRRLRDFGLVPGTKVSCRYRSPWGDVTALSLRGSVLAMRTKDLRKIRVRG
ncbi:MAG TPA: ferrous iron transport protein A [Candidatus Faecousia intestinigallinarum]|nr:ferrous iron transport protein A [Candidatus Faecousia intestinigallinarum]